MSTYSTSTRLRRIDDRIEQLLKKRSEILQRLDFKARAIYRARDYFHLTCRALGYPPETVLAPNKDDALVLARACYYRVASERGRLPNGVIAQAVSRDRTTVAYHLNVLRDRLERETAVAELYRRVLDYVDDHPLMSDSLRPTS